MCGQKLAEHDWPDVQHEGYADEKEYRWLCGQCGQDFQTILSLNLIGGPKKLPEI
jgi:ribosomal protein S27AE